MADETRLCADEEGVWENHPGGRRLRIAWPEVYRVSAGKFDCINYELLNVVMDTDYGEFVEMNENEKDCGFEETMSVVASHLPGIDPAWLNRAKALTARDDDLLVWQRETGT